MYVPAFFSSSVSSFQSFCCTNSNWSWSATFSSLLSLSQCASTLDNGIGATRVEDWAVAGTSTWFAVAVARHRLWATRAGRRAAVRVRRSACILKRGGDKDFLGGKSINDGKRRKRGSLTNGKSIAGLGAW